MANRCQQQQQQSLQLFALVPLILMHQCNAVLDLELRKNLRSALDLAVEEGCNSANDPSLDLAISQHDIDDKLYFTKLFGTNNIRCGSHYKDKELAVAKADESFLNGNVRLASKLYYYGLGCNADTAIKIQSSNIHWDPTLTKYFAVKLNRSIATDHTKLLLWPAIADRERSSAEFLQRFDSEEGTWFHAFPGQESARALLPLLSRDSSGLFEFVNKIDTIDNFTEKYFRQNRPVIVGADASPVLLHKHLQKGFSVWSRKAVSESNATILVGSVAYADRMMGGFATEYVSPDDIKNASPQSVRSKCETTDHTTQSSTSTCATAITALQAQRKTMRPMTLAEFSQSVMEQDTFDIPFAPDLRCTFSPSGPSAIDFSNLTFADFPDFMADVVTGEHDTDCSQCPGSERKCWCKFQFYFGPAMSGSQCHTHKPAWNALMRGRKRWIVFPPSIQEEYWSPTQMQQPAHTWYTETLPKIKAKGIIPMEFDQLPGEVVFVPGHFPHAVVNLEPSIGFAVEINHLSPL